jgi:hypothetical protein
MKVTFGEKLTSPNTATKKAQEKVKTQIIRSMSVALNTIIGYTPVWTGRTIQNYLWSVNGIKQAVLQRGVIEDWRKVKDDDDSNRKAEAVDNALGSLKAAQKMVRAASWPVRVYLFNPTRYKIEDDEDDESGMSGSYVGIEALEDGFIGLAPGGYKMFAKTATKLRSMGIAGIGYVY